MFEAKLYNDVRKTLGLANCAYALAVMLIVFFYVLSPDQQAQVPKTAEQLGIPPWLAGTITAAFVAGLWAYLSTAFFRLHDRVFEPWLTEWRRYYETDFILRGLCFDFSDVIAPRAFEDAFENHRKRAKLLQKLFYAFVGDHVDQHAALRDRFYSHIRNYWIIGLGEVYCLGVSLIAATYAFLVPSSNSQIPLLLGVSVVTGIILRVYSWRYLRGVRAITEEQISAILDHHKPEFSTALSKVAEEMGFKR